MFVSALVPASLPSIPLLLVPLRLFLFVTTAAKAACAVTVPAAVSCGASWQ
jgi:hypothetical protein